MNCPVIIKAREEAFMKRTPDQKRIRELEKKLRDTEMERDILKKAMAIYGGPQSMNRSNAKISSKSFFNKIKK